MQAGNVVVTTVKPQLRRLRIEGVREHDQFINDWTWVSTSELAVSIHNALQRIDPDRKAAPTPLGLEIFVRYGLLNSEQAGEAYVTWVITYDTHSEYCILGKTPREELLTPEHGNFLLAQIEARLEIYIPATWGLNILELAEKGVVEVTARERDSRGEPYFTLTAHMLDGSQRDILLAGSQPQCKYYLQKDQLD